ncbi:DUF354 domain-containing protein [Methanosphaerula palustris]|uniref:DUF354 domain-containing protein n=1 Tax=Methanosphaerula palustris (strain ATCC BAA-1556 / DSM 19958 / E1-9c) TaxID=521011 RepID=B8GGE1_METPE|nr:DUF354 domain-containing protein [Methanosphaerula palustris]ACL16196.1 protein of unknown function DUF354 [Methanosphaerula palustris E1-9c]
MNILINIGHPAHVHFFKYFLWEMQKKGHNLVVYAVNKDVSLDLLKNYHIGYELYGDISSNFFGQILEIIKGDYKTYNMQKKYDIDIMIGIADAFGAHISKITHAKSIVFTDTEHATLINAITFPFADVICTPASYKKNLGRKQIRYNGYHELAYLHPHYFIPDPSVLTELGLTEDDPFIIVRFVSWKASHDVGQHGVRDRVGLVKALEKYGRVLITSEGVLPDELKPYQISVLPEKLHDLLYYATLYVGEGGTTASEAATLGTHAIHISTTGKYCGIFSDLNRYGLLWTSESDEDTIEKAIELLQDPDLKDLGQKKRNRLVDEKIDVTAFMVWFVDHYPESAGIMKGKTDFPNDDASRRLL